MATASSPSAASTSPTGTPADPFAGLPHIPPIDNTFGALLIGTFIGLMYVVHPSSNIFTGLTSSHSQYGWTAHQSYHYFRMYGKDRWVLKTLVRGPSNTFRPSLTRNRSRVSCKSFMFQPRSPRVCLTPCHPSSPAPSRRFTASCACTSGKLPAMPRRSAVARDG